MTGKVLSGARLAGIVSAVPHKTFDNINDTQQFNSAEVKKVVALAGVKARHISDGSICTSDLCFASAERLLRELNWSPDSVDVLICITQSPDYFLPGVSSLIHKSLGLGQNCAVFDLGLGCSGYPYGLWLANMMVQTGSANRVLLLHGDTPSLFTAKEDRSTYLLFGDGGTASGIEADSTGGNWGYSLHSDGSGYSDLIIPGGGFRQRQPARERDYCVHMHGPNLFNFTITKVPKLIEETLALMNVDAAQTDLFFFHQSNQFIMKHIAKKCGLEAHKVPIILDRFGNIGGASVPLTMTQYFMENKPQTELNVMLLGYGVGLSWASAYISIDANLCVDHVELKDAPLASLLPNTAVETNA